MNIPTPNLPGPVGAESAQSLEIVGTPFEVFCRLVAVIPENSSLLASPGVLKPTYSSADGAFNSGKVWHDIATLAQIATRRTAMSVAPFTSVVVVNGSPDITIRRFKELLAASGDHEKALRELARKMDDEFEKATSGWRGEFTERESYLHYNDREELAALYRESLKPGWVQDDLRAKMGNSVLLATRMIDDLCRVQDPNSQENPARRATPVLALVRVIAETLTQREGRTLYPDDATILRRYARFYLAWHATQEILPAALAEYHALPEVNGVKPNGRDFEAISNRRHTEYMEKHTPQGIDDVPAESRQAIGAKIFNDRLDSAISRAIREQQIPALVQHVLTDGELAQRYQQLSDATPTPERRALLLAPSVEGKQLS